MPAPSSRREFLDALAAAGVLAPRLLERAERLSSHATTAAAAADVLVRSGLVTHFQADRLLAGKTDGFVLGQYCILDPIRTGTVGRVYKARHRAMDRLVAIKVLAAEWTRDPERRRAFLLEARRAARLTHPHLVTVLDCNRVGERVYVVLEYVAGAAADAIVRAGGALAPPRAVEIARQVALGLAHAHDLGTVHGGLSPADVLVGRPGGAGLGGGVEVKVANLGTGRLLTSRQASAECDPADFLAPECLDGREPTAAADVFALGATLHFLLTARPPGAGTCPAALAPVVARLTAVDPHARPSAARAAELLAAAAPPDDTVDFALPVTDPAGASGGYLSGLMASPHAPTLDDTFPWAGLDATPPPPTQRKPLARRAIGALAARLFPRG